VFAVDGRRRGEVVGGERIHKEIDKNKGEQGYILKRERERGINVSIVMTGDALVNEKLLGGKRRVSRL
jgi:hypothetical protein